MKTYNGYINSEGRFYIIVYDSDRDTSSYYGLAHVVRHTSIGMDIGNGGKRSADTALSILTDCLGDKLASSLHQLFKWDFIAPLTRKLGHCMEITEEKIRFWADIQLGKAVGAPETNEGLNETF